MGNPIPFQTRVARSITRLREWFAGQGDVEAVVIIIKRKDETVEVTYTRQSLADLAYASSILQHEVYAIMDGHIDLVHEEV